MKRMIVALLFAAITGFTFGQTVGEKQRKGNAEDETAVRQVVAALGETWNRHDGKAYSLLFTEDMDFVTIGGNSVRGRAELEKLMAWLFGGVYKDSPNTMTTKAIRFLKPDVAVAHAESEVVRSEHGEKVPLKTLMTLVLVKDRRAWLITAAENTDVRTPPPSPAK